MSKRSLIKFGKNSFIISLPITWIKRNKLKKGSEIDVEETTKTLIITTNNNKPSELKTKKISCDDFIDVRRNIISAYMNNYSIIEIRGQKLKDHIKDIEEITHSLVALEIMEQSSNKVVLKDFLNTQDISVDSIIKRVDVIIHVMYLEIVESYSKKETINLNKMDVDVNRLYYVGYKLLNKLLDNPSISKSLNIDIKDTLYYWNIIDTLEKIADQHKRFAKYFFAIEDEPMKKHLIKTLEIIIKRYLTIMKSFYRLDKRDAYLIISTSKETLNNIEEIIDKHINTLKKVIDIHNTSEAVEKLKKFENGIFQLSKTIINKN